MPGPAYQERFTDSSFIKAPFAAAKETNASGRGIMFFIIAWPVRWPVITRQNNDGIFRQSCLIQHLQQTADLLIYFIKHRIILLKIFIIGKALEFLHRFRLWIKRIVYIIQPKLHIKWLI